MSGKQSLCLRNPDIEIIPLGKIFNFDFWSHSIYWKKMAIRTARLLAVVQTSGNRLREKNEILEATFYDIVPFYSYKLSSTNSHVLHAIKCFNMALTSRSQKTTLNSMRQQNTTEFCVKTRFSCIAELTPIFGRQYCPENSSIFIDLHSSNTPSHWKFPWRIPASGFPMESNTEIRKHNSRVTHGIQHWK